jgi:hypothetical protein
MENEINEAEKLVTNPDALKDKAKNGYKKNHFANEDLNQQITSTAWQFWDEGYFHGSNDLSGKHDQTKSTQIKTRTDAQAAIIQSKAISVLEAESATLEGSIDEKKRIIAELEREISTTNVLIEDSNAHPLLYNRVAAGSLIIAALVLIVSDFFVSFEAVQNGIFNMAEKISFTRWEILKVTFVALGFTGISFFYKIFTDEVFGASLLRRKIHQNRATENLSTSSPHVVKGIKIGKIGRFFILLLVASGATGVLWTAANLRTASEKHNRELKVYKISNSGTESKTRINTNRPKKEAKEVIPPPIFPEDRASHAFLALAIGAPILGGLCLSFGLGISTNRISLKKTRTDHKTRTEELARILREKKIAEVSKTNAEAAKLKVEAKTFIDLFSNFFCSAYWSGFDYAYHNPVKNSKGPDLYDRVDRIRNLIISNQP